MDKEITTPEYSGPERRGNPWHLKREISVGHLLTTISMLLAAFWFFAGLDKRVTVLEQVSGSRSIEIQRRLTGMESKIDEVYRLLLNSESIKR
ncbi:hypothetical protein [Sedimenticola selenatireducens]|uniref:Uncharacterized protein n=1 Tax=Sedimenticola selenatireducens TaxID=191960 RepID=A0A557SCJ6_9GAMM|nr:hypothetical protein [Sedimenticola selenatireducens]TVO75126.1 hypothetical protein FHP88_08925 [Sedimenticola selenatireducens]TVT67019.1 MAG: hypothetical protein FHK78_01430 [Sedimenticola selenatireducens]